MKIKRTVIQKAVEKAYREGHKWARLDQGHTYTIMIDISNGDIWVDTFIDCNSWKEYRSETIQGLSFSRGGLKDYTSESIEAGYVADAVELLENSGWEIED